MSNSKYVKHPSFCYIAPTSHLQDVLASKTHLVLAHLVDEDETYADFYHDLGTASGDFIMMDNSAYELKVPYAPTKLIELASKCAADVVVLPDYPFQPASVTIEAAKEFIPQFKEVGLGTFFVPQSKKGDLEDWIQAYIWAAENPDIDVIGMSILGIPNALSNIDPAYARVVMTQLLIDRGVFNFDKHHHYLGLNAGPALEIPSLLRMNALDTIDSSGPIWSAILGHEYTINADSYLATSKPKMPVNFHIKESRDAATITRINHNITLTQSLFAGANDVKTWYAQE